MLVIIKENYQEMSIEAAKQVASFNKKKNLIAL